MSDKPKDWFDQQIDAFNAVLPHFDAFRAFLEQALRHMLKDSMLPEAVIQVRTKREGSFVGKILRKQDKYQDQDCIKVLTDLCAGRVIVHTKSEVERVCAFLREHFVIDKPNSLDKAEELQVAEFGYRSVHLIVSLTQARLDAMTALKLLDENSLALIKPEILGLKAEIQVRTIAQHAWADIGHDRVYKSEFKVPDRWKRELAKIAALLEDADDAFTRIIEGLSLYKASYGLYGDQKKMKAELRVLKKILEKDAENANLTCQAVRLATCLAATAADWQTVKELVNSFPAVKTADLLVYQGEAMSRLNEPHKEVEKVLKEAVNKDSTNVRALTAYAETLASMNKSDNEDEVYRHYRKAFTIDPTNPRVLGGYLRFKLGRDHDRSFIPLIRPTLDAAIRKCRDLAQAGIDKPWAYRHIGEFNLLLAGERMDEEADDLPEPDGRSFDSLAAFARAIQLPETTEIMLDDWLRALAELKKVTPPLEGLEWVRRLLVLGKAVKSSDGKCILEAESLPFKDLMPVKEPVVIVAGSCNPAHEAEMVRYGTRLEKAFEGFAGTIYSGGTTAGISGLVGNLMDRFKEQFFAFGYHPSRLPHDGPKDSRYTTTYTMKKETRFSPLQPLQNWIDLIALGINPAHVKLLGIKGGPIAAFEYRLALALGAQVGLLQESGLEAGSLQTDPDWRDDDGLVLLSEKEDSVREFLERPREIQLLARRLHDRYLSQSRPREVPRYASLVEWRDLTDHFREDNLRQAAELRERLLGHGLTLQVVEDRGPIVNDPIDEDKVDDLAKQEHASWKARKELEGWRYGTMRNDEAKKNPLLVEWEKLPRQIMEKNREIIRQIPEVLAGIGVRIVKQ